MLKSADLLHNVGGYVGSDEAYTPAYAVTPIFKYILEIKNRVLIDRQLQEFIVWCPFDTEDSEFVKLINKFSLAIKVVHSHISTGQDFFEYEPEEWDIIVSNPPFKKKRLFFERALSFGKPFALLMTNACLNDKYPAWSFVEAGSSLQLLKFDKRIHFVQDGITSKKTTFSSSYFCSNFLPSNLIQESLTV